MKTTHHASILNMNAARHLAVGALVLTMTFPGSATIVYGSGKKPHGCRACEGTANLAHLSALNDATADYWLEVGIANNLPDADDRSEALDEAQDKLKDNRDEARDQYEARLEACKDLEECRYAPEIEPDNFLTPNEAAADPNPYLPLIPGQTYIYQKVNDEGTEEIRVHVTDETREILGVTCRVVADTATLDGEVMEDTLDWYAQDTHGHVWYFGEQSLQYENDKIASLDGSWEAGEDGARPGIVMKANPVAGDLYRQEFALGEAEDLAEVLSLDESESVPYGSFDHCLETGDFSPLEPGVLEHKYFVPGLGQILSVDVDTGDREELIDIITE